MATKFVRSNRNASARKAQTKEYKPSEEALGLNRKLENGNTLVHCFGAKGDAKALVTVIADRLNRFWINIRPRRKNAKPFSRPVDQVFRPKGMTIARLAYTASRTGHVYAMPRAHA